MEPNSSFSISLGPSLQAKDIQEILEYINKESDIIYIYKEKILEESTFASKQEYKNILKEQSELSKKFLRARSIFSRKLLYNNYSKQNRRLLNDKCNIAYAHEEFLFYENGQPWEKIDAKEIKGKFDLEKTLDIPNYIKLAQDFRTDKRDRVPDPGSTVRVCKIDDDFTFILQKADYMDEFVSDQKKIVDIPIEDITKNRDEKLYYNYRGKKTLRMINKDKGKLIDFEDSKVANTIGIASSVITYDGYLLLPRRNKLQHFQSGYFGCSVSRALRWFDNHPKKFLSNMIFNLKERGVKEISLDKEECLMIPLSFTRELERIGKPQFFFHTWSLDEHTKFRSWWIFSRKTDYDSLGWVPIFDPHLISKDSKAVVKNAINRLKVLIYDDHEIKLNGKLVALSEEFRASLFYLIKYLEICGTEALPPHWIKK